MSLGVLVLSPNLPASFLNLLSALSFVFSPSFSFPCWLFAVFMLSSSVMVLFLLSLKVSLKRNYFYDDDNLLTVCSLHFTSKKEKVVCKRSQQTTEKKKPKTNDTQKEIEMLLLCCFRIIKKIEKSNKSFLLAVFFSVGQFVRWVEN